MGEEASPRLGSNGSVFNKRKQITAEAAERINAAFRGKEFDHLALCGCGMSKEVLCELLHEEIQKKTVLITVSYTGRPAWAEAIRLIRNHPAFDAKAEGIAQASRWLEDLIDPNEVTALSGQIQCLLALEARMVRQILLSNPPPPSMDDAHPDLEDFLIRECEIAGAELIRVSDDHSSKFHMFSAYGGIGGYFHHGFSEDDLDKITNLNEEEVSPESVSTISEGTSFDIFTESLSQKQHVPEPAAAPIHTLGTKGSIGKRTTKPNVNLVFCGHVDAGKSTTVGHLLVKTGAIDERTVCKSGAFQFAHLCDTDPEERARGVTVECGFHSFETPKRKFTIIDAPGHQNFLVNFIAGAHQADIAVLLLSARANEFEDGFNGGQTKEHCKVLRGLGVQNIVLAVNKMDACGWNQNRYEEIVQRMRDYLVKNLQFDAKKILHVPVSGFEGLNLTEQDVPCEFSPGCLLDRLKSFKIKRRKVQDLRVTITERERVGKGKVRVRGRVEHGVLRKGQTVTIMPGNLSATVADVTIASEDLEAAFPGDLITLHLRGVEENQFQVGSLLCDTANPTRPVKEIHARIQLCKDEMLMTGYRGVFHAHALTVEVKVREIKNSKSALTREGEWAEVCLAFDEEYAVEAYKEFKRLGAFVLRNEESSVALGRIVQN